MHPPSGTRHKQLAATSGGGLASSARRRTAGKASQGIRKRRADPSALQRISKQGGRPATSPPQQQRGPRLSLELHSHPIGPDKLWHVDDGGNPSSHQPGKKRQSGRYKRPLLPPPNRPPPQFVRGCRNSAGIRPEIRRNTRYSPRTANQTEDYTAII
jgi:hypothetical protein